MGWSLRSSAATAYVKVSVAVGAEASSGGHIADLSFAIKENPVPTSHPHNNDYGK